MALVHVNKTSLAEVLHRYYLFLTILQRWKIEVFVSFFSAPSLAQYLFDKCQSAEWEVAGSNPGQTNTQGLKITEESVLPLL